MPAPPWQAARNGLPNDSSAPNQSAQINQLLAAHPSSEIYAGAAVVAPNGNGAGSNDPNDYWAFHLDAWNYDQPFTMSGTTIGRITLPILPVGNGADLVVSLCADNAGIPGNVITTTRVPASWIKAMAGVSAIATGTGTINPRTNSGPLVLPQNNVLRVGVFTSTPLQGPAASATATVSGPSMVAGGNYIIAVGGYVPGTNSPVSTVYTIALARGVLGATAIQPALPQTLSAATAIATGDTLVCAGGHPTSSTYGNSVYTAQWDPIAGRVGTWSQQAVLPVNVANAGGAAYGNTVYVVGGLNINGALGSVYYSTISNGQLTSWTSGPPLPVTLQNPAVAVFGNTLVVAGGLVSGNFAGAAVYYTPINADGSLTGAWQRGPDMPTAVSADSAVATTSSGLVLVGGFVSSSTTTPQIQALTFGADRQPGQWSAQTYSNNHHNGFMVPSGVGQWQLFALLDNSYYSTTVYATPQISVPLPASGLVTNGSYHILLRQAGGDLNNYLRTCQDYNDLSMSTVQYADKKGGSSAWIPFSGTFGYIPLNVYDTSVRGQPLHLWEDNGDRIATLLYATTPDRRLLGIAEATSVTKEVYNSNTGFESGISPWTATGGTVVQSTTQKHSGTYSAQLTPSGTAAQVYIGSEQVAIPASGVVRATAWVWVTAAVTNAYSTSVNWFDVNHTYLSTSSAAVSLTAQTWTQVTNTFLAPLNAVYAQLVPTLSGTPAATQITYIDDAAMSPLRPATLSDVAAVTYPGAWPNGAWPPLGVTAL